MVHKSTFEKFRKIKMIYQAEIGKQIIDDEFVLDLLVAIKGLIKNESWLNE